MESIVAAWNDMGILNEVWKHKLIFVETPDANETSIALENYRRVSAFQFQHVGCNILTRLLHVIGMQQRPRCCAAFRRSWKGIGRD